MNLKNVEKKEKNTAVLTIEVGAEEFNAAVEKVYRKNKGVISLPGFRKGHAPRKLVEQMYGADVFYEDAVNDLYPVVLTEAIKEAGLKLSDRVLLIMGCNEESGSKDMEHYMSHIGMPDYGFSPDSGFPVCYAEKGIHRIAMTAAYEGESPIVSMKRATPSTSCPIAAMPCCAGRKRMRRSCARRPKSWEHPVRRM